ncbi:MAG TPA: dynamin family protein [Ideonella sp.]|nr:dynamin family protein [Ideonella sp.]
MAGSLDALGAWRQALLRRLDELARRLEEHDLHDEAVAEMLSALRSRLSSEKLVLAFVAEFSRGKSELINAIFFADAGRRVLPATPGRTTMCPVELGYDPGEPPALALLPIETRLDGRSLAELRAQPSAWTLVPLHPAAPERLGEALAAVTRTRKVSVDEARALGFWDDEHPDDNPPAEAGRVEVPIWRHALVNWPHPLLERGLVVLDTPGLNAIGAEPELTLGLLPSAHATVFILGADTGVTRSDLAIWREHLASHGRSRYVALNKIDTLADPLTPDKQVRSHIERQRFAAAQTLGVEPERVFPVSARQALAARIEGDDAALAESRLPELESALAAQLLPQRRALLEHWVLAGAQQLETHLTRRLADRRRQLAEQMLELRGLRGKSGAKLRVMLERVDAEAAEFEQCTARLHAMRAVHGRMLREALRELSNERARDLIAELQRALAKVVLGLGARRAFARLCESLRGLLQSAEQRGREIHTMLVASFEMLNTDYGFGLALAEPPALERFRGELELIERNYVRYLGLGRALRLAQPVFMEQFRRMLLARLRVVLEGASAELELWNRAASTQIDAQLRERRRGFKRRREALQRIQGAAGELEQRLAEFEAQEARLTAFQAQLADDLQALRQHARGEPTPQWELPLAEPARRLTAA